MLSSEALQRYKRQIILEGFGTSSQEKLSNSKVLIIGAGGLGSPVLLYLAAAGIGTLGIIDFDKVDESNLQRQILYSSNDIGKYKADVACKKIKKLNPLVNIISWNTQLTELNATEILADFDVIVDGSDNFATRYLVNDTCINLGKPFVSASILKYEAQVGAFNVNIDGVFSSNYRDVFSSPPVNVPSCSEAGVIGPLAGIAGSIQANEVIKLISGIGKPLINKLLVIDILQNTFTTLKIQRTIPGNKKEAEQTDFRNFAQSPNIKDIMKEVTVQQLKEKLENNEDFQLIDVREPHEYEIANLGGELIPLGSILNESDRIAKDKAVIIHCRSGARSGTAIMELEKRFGFTNLYNLKGGILAYSREIDSSIPTY